MWHWLTLIALLGAPAPVYGQDRTRVATFNASLNRDLAGALVKDLSTPHNPQAKSIAAIIQKVRPDVLLLQEFDYDEAGRALTSFHDNYLRVGQADLKPIEYPYRWAVPSNTGMPTGLDLDRDGKTDGPGDAQGCGKHAGQYAYALLSRVPFDPTEIRTFRSFRWAQMPGARLPSKDRSPWYSPAALKILRLSSKNHVIVPLKIRKRVLYLLAAHPTPPVFDGPEDRNGRRNADEIRLLADALSPAGGGYMIDDAGVKGGLPDGAAFVIMGDLNADPMDGDSADGAISQLLEHPQVRPDVADGARTPRSVGGEHRTAKPGLKGDRARHTAQWGLRVDYVLPSRGLTVLDTGVFWPEQKSPMGNTVNGSKDDKAPTDHRLVWVDLGL